MANIKDLSVIYNGKLLSVKDDLEQLRELSFDTTKIEKAISQIEEDVEKNVSENYLLFDKADSKTFLHESVGSVYTKATEKLVRISDIINEEYQAYYIINAKYVELKKIVNAANKNNIEDIIQKGLELLDSIKYSSTIDYNMEKSLVENIYELIYTILKLELVYGKDDMLLEKISSDETDCSYLVKLVKENIERISKEERSYIDDITAKLAVNGLDDSDYLNKELLTAIVIAEDDSISQKIDNKFMEEYNNYQNKNKKYSLVLSQNENLITENQKCKKEKRKRHLRKIRKLGFTYINTALIAAGILTSAYTLKDATKSKDYLTTVTTYDSSTEEETKNEYYEEKRDNSNEVTLVEYSPWDTPGYFRDEYTRNVYTYDLSDLEGEFSDIKNYLNSKIKNDISFSEKDETTDEKPKDLDYQGNKYVITATRQNTGKFQYNKNRSNTYWAIATLLSALGIIATDFIIIEKILRLKSYGDYKREYKYAKEELKENDLKLLESRKQLDDLEIQLKELHKKILTEYEALPVAIKDSPKIKEKILELNDKNNNS